MNRKKHLGLYLVLIIILLCSIIFGCCCGSADVGYTDAVKIIMNKVFRFNFDITNIASSKQTIVWKIRFPRVLLGALVGGILSISGATYQSLLKNPMADPYVIGVSSGAAFGAAIGIASNISFSLLGLSFTSLMAFVCAIIVILMVYKIARIGNKVPMTTLLLSGIAVANFLTAFTSLIMIYSGDDMQKIVFWTMGSLSGKGWDFVAMLLPYAILGFIAIYYFANDLNIIMLGEDTAGNLGVDVEKTKKILLIVSAVITAAAVSVSGIIGFVGLIVPHITRMITGPDNKRLIPASFIVGGILLTLCDTLSRSILSQEIPVGIITSILGGPFFIYLLRTKKKEIF